jgi:hypothetical protein
MDHEIESAMSRCSRCGGQMFEAQTGWVVAA